MNIKKRGSVTYSTDRENEVSKIFIIYLRLIRHAGEEKFKFSRPYNEIRPTELTNHLARTERYNNMLFHSVILNSMPIQTV